MGVHADQPARMHSRSLTGDAATSSGFTAGSLLFFTAGREAFFRGKCVFGSSSSSYEALTGVEAMRAEIREGGRFGSSLRLFTGGHLTMSRVVDCEL